MALIAVTALERIRSDGLLQKVGPVCVPDDYLPLVAKLEETNHPARVLTYGQITAKLSTPRVETV